MNRNNRLIPGLSRRHLLGGLGLGIGALTLPSLLPRGARAGSPGPVKRLLIVMTDHGTVYPNWRMRPNGLGDDTDWEVPLAGLAEADFSEILRPLHGMRDQLLVLDGLGMATGLLTPLNEHEVGHATALTGTQAQPIEGGIAIASGPSIDHIVAAAVAQPGQIASLQVSHGGWAYGFDAAGKPLPWLTDPFEMYAKLFPGVPGDPNQPTELDHIRSKQAKVVELVRQQYSSLAPRLGSEDRLKVEQHRDLLHALGEQLEYLVNLSCESPPSPDPQPSPNDLEFYFARTQAYATLTAAALSCDITRVGLLGYNGIDTGHVGVGPGDLHADYIHQQSLDPVAAAVVTTMHTLHAGSFKQLIETLAAVPDVDGSLLDNTIVMWGSELCTGDHSLSQWPVVLAGGKNVFKTGRYVRWAQSNVVKAQWTDEPQGPPHSRLLVSLAQGMDLDIDQVGDADVPLVNGGTLSCKGPLDRLA